MEDRKILRVLNRKDTGVVSLLTDIRFYLKSINEWYETGFGLHVWNNPAAPNVLDVVGI